MGRAAPSAKPIFLLDGLGGLLTAFMLGVVLPSVREHVGMAADTLHRLGGIGLLYGVNSLGCHLFLRENHREWLEAILLANLLYCVGTAVVVALQLHAMRVAGLVYFAIEFTVILALVCVEDRVRRALP